MSVEGSSKKSRRIQFWHYVEKKAENTRWYCLTWVEKECKEKEKPSQNVEADPSKGLVNVLKKMYKDGDDAMKHTINKP